MLLNITPDHLDRDPTMAAYADAKMRIIRQLQKGDVFVNPSREEEFGRVMIEAIAARLPIVATKTLGAKAILSKKQSAFTFDYENPREGGNLISKILSSTKLRKELKEEGLSRVQVFDKDRIVEGFKKLF